MTPHLHLIRPDDDLAVDGLTLNLGQVAAVREIREWAQSDEPRFMSLSGPAGSGKTTILRALKSVLGRNVSWSAMTGRAARRMREAAGVRATTLHRALYHLPREIDNAKKKRIDLAFEEVRAENAPMLVVDESSMIDRKTLDDIARSPCSKILLVGDDYQLPPVSEDQGDWSVFREVSGPRLTEVMRTAGAIVEAATVARERQAVPTDCLEHGGSRYDFSTDFRSALQDWFDDFEDHVIVVWKNETRMRLNRQIRQIFGHSGDLPDPGEPVVVRRNDHRQEMMNGDLLYVDAWLGEGPELAGIRTRYVRLRENAAPPIPGDPFEFNEQENSTYRTILTVLDGRDNGPFDGYVPYVGLDKWKGALASADVEEPIPITYGYCTTCHMIQGSEFRRATTLLFGDLANRNLRKMTALSDGSRVPMGMRLLYTAITRAKERAVVVAERT